MRAIAAVALVLAAALPMMPAAMACSPPQGPFYRIEKPFAMPMRDGETLLTLHFHHLQENPYYHHPDGQPPPETVRLTVPAWIDVKDPLEKRPVFNDTHRAYLAWRLEPQRDGRWAAEVVGNGSSVCCIKLRTLHGTTQVVNRDVPHLPDLRLRAEVVPGDPSRIRFMATLAEAPAETRLGFTEANHGDTCGPYKMVLREVEGRLVHELPAHGAMVTLDVTPWAHHLYDLSSEERSRFSSGVEVTGPCQRFVYDRGTIQEVGTCDEPPVHRPWKEGELDALVRSQQSDGLAGLAVPGVLLAGVALRRRRD